MLARTSLGLLVLALSTGCVAATEREEGADCADGVDNDADAYLDCADSDCEGESACQQPGADPSSPWSDAGFLPDEHPAAPNVGPRPAIPVTPPPGQTYCLDWDSVEVVEPEGILAALDFFSNIVIEDYPMLLSPLDEDGDGLADTLRATSTNGGRCTQIPFLPTTDLAIVEWQEEPNGEAWFAAEPGGDSGSADVTFWWSASAWLTAGIARVEGVMSQDPPQLRDVVIQGRLDITHAPVPCNLAAISCVQCDPECVPVEADPPDTKGKTCEQCLPMDMRQAVFERSADGGLVDVDR